MASAASMRHASCVWPLAVFTIGSTSQSPRPADERPPALPHGNTVHQAHARQRPRRHRARASAAADGGGQRLVSRRIEERAPGPHRLRASFRTPDVRGIGALRSRVFPAAAAGRRTAQRIDQSRSHQLLGGRADRRARAGAVDGIRSHGLSAAGAHRREVREPARRRPQRAPPELRESAVWPGRHRDLGGALSARSSVSLADDRVGRRSARGVARRGAGRSSAPTTTRPMRR